MSSPVVHDEDSTPILDAAEHLMSISSPPIDTPLEEGRLSPSNVETSSSPITAPASLSSPNPVHDPTHHPNASQSILTADPLIPSNSYIMSSINPEMNPPSLESSVAMSAEPSQVLTNTNNFNNSNVSELFIHAFRPPPVDVSGSNTSVGSNVQTPVSGHESSPNKVSPSGTGGWGETGSNNIK